MGVVINDFEVLHEPRPAAQREAREGTGDDGGKPTKPEPAALAPVLRELQLRALRAWAH
jgi:hypothetical protein